ncbi:MULTISPECIES: FtsK/SpoIIIE domain-containing protein [Cytobacillus]|uniref:FtsK domain-containing protein n=1 Tax=Cytobacillus kochii TaxID=859143 RepID=A0A248TPK6_9BACI|nr:FtsK/SpoIIIE domain-containing protein [Cytobacillus kochii]ASV70164.1 hypothetical protein CKF48_23025 [Cytobacillus kochii]MDQ0186736.1 S-DNA-T family DNA segregation ATPase FtsK/SpoIIIE [Cytobacillus kochii]
MFKEYLMKKKAKSKLNKCFRQGNICLKYKKEERTYRLFPKILNVRFDKDCTVYRFVLLTGIHPDTVYKNTFVFHQVFNPHIHLENESDDKTFTLKVYDKGLPSYTSFNFPAFKEIMKKYEIPILMGVDQSNQIRAFDLKKFHHVQITGVTNTGKSVYLKTILTSLILYFSSEDIHFYLGDMKRTELTLFKNIKHTKQTATNLEDLLIMLLFLKQEVEKRYELMEAHEVSHIDEVTNLTKITFPIIICMIDEFGLCAQNKEILKVVQDLTSIARAANVYVFLSLQRADSTVVSGIAKNNLGVKISFKQSNQINAKVAGVPGVEQLKLSEKGRAIMDIGSEIKKIQTPLIRTEEVKELISPFRQKEAKKENNAVVQQEEKIFGIVSEDE